EHPERRERWLAAARLVDHSPRHARGALAERTGDELARAERQTGAALRTLDRFDAARGRRDLRLRSIDALVVGEHRAHAGSDLREHGLRRVEDPLVAARAVGLRAARTVAHRERRLARRAERMP